MATFNTNNLYVEALDRSRATTESVTAIFNPDVAPDFSTRFADHDLYHSVFPRTPSFPYFTNTSNDVSKIEGYIVLPDSDFKIKCMKKPNQQHLLNMNDMFGWMWEDNA